MQLAKVSGMEKRLCESVVGKEAVHLRDEVDSNLFQITNCQLLGKIFKFLYTPIQSAGHTGGMDHCRINKKVIDGCFG
jgi:hypothetical protein